MIQKKHGISVLFVFIFVRSIRLSQYDVLDLDHM